MIIKYICRHIRKSLNQKKRVKLKKQIAQDCVFSNIMLFDPNSTYEGRNVIHEGVEFSGRIGYGSYIGPNSKLPKTSIGRYCSIAQNVQLISGRHPSRNYVSTHPSFFSTMKQAGFTYVSEQKYDEYKYVDPQKRYLLKIGNDVWIGANVIFLEGISVGDGAIVAAGAIVVKDVPPYAIVGGCPAKIIRYRFSQEDIEFLKDFKWWEKERDWIRENASLFDDIRVFRNQVGEKIKK